MDDFELHKNAPKLFGLPKKNVHKVPDDFFPGMECDILQQRSLQKKSRLKKISRWAQFSVAAAIAVVVIFSGIKTLLSKQYHPTETIRMIYNINDGDIDGE